MIEISANYWENLIGVLLAFALLALTIERALYQIFDSKLWSLIEEKLDGQAGGDYMDLKPWISVACLSDNYPPPPSGLHRGRP